MSPSSSLIFLSDLSLFPRIMSALRSVLVGDSGGMGPADLAEANSQNQSAATTINTFTESLLSCSDFPDSLEGAPNLGENQERSRKVATDWKSNVRIRIYNSNTTLLAQSSKFLNLYDILYELAGDLNEQNKKDFITGLDILQKGVRDAVIDSEGAMYILQDFDVDLTDVVKTLRADHTAVEAIYEGDGGEIKQLEDVLDAAEDARQVNLTILSLGATMAVCGGLTIVAGVAFSVVTGGSATKIVVGGIIFTVGGTTAMIIASDDLKKQNKTIEDTTARIAFLESSIALLAAVCAEMEALGIQGAEALEKLDFLIKQWQVLVVELEELRGRVADMDPDKGLFLRPQLNVAKQQWEDVDETAHLIKDQVIGIPVDMDPPNGISISTALTQQNDAPHRMFKYPGIPVYMDAGTSSFGVAMNINVIASSLGELSAVMGDHPSGTILAKSALLRVASAAGPIACDTFPVAYMLRMMGAKMVSKMEMKTSKAKPAADKTAAVRECVKSMTKTLVTALRRTLCIQKKINMFVKVCGSAISEVTCDALAFEADGKAASNMLSLLKADIRKANRKLGRGRKKAFEAAIGVSGESIIDSMIDRACAVGSEKRNLKQLGKKLLKRELEDGGDTLGRDFKDEDLITFTRAEHKWLGAMSTMASSLHDEVMAFMSVLRSWIVEFDLVGNQLPDRLLSTWADAQSAQVIRSLRTLAGTGTV